MTLEVRKFPGFALSGRLWAILLLSCAGWLATVPVQAAPRFVQSGNGGSTVQYFTALPAADTDPNSIYFITLRNTSFFGNYPVAAFFDDGLRSRIVNWGIARVDGRPLPGPFQFNVANRAADANVFTHEATPLNSISNVTYLDHPLLNKNPKALIWLTQNVHAGEPIRRNAHQFIAQYFPSSERWGIVNQGWNPFDVIIGETFNVLVETAPFQGSFYFYQTATAANTVIAPSGARVMTINHPMLRQQPRPNAIMLVTPVYNPRGTATGTYNDHPVSVIYNSANQTWSVYNADFTHIPLGASFNIYIISGG